ncbi:MAG: NADH-quinone oxidoreductase subunit N [Pseudomonadota bacterium]
MSTADLNVLLPELALALFAMGALVTGAFRGPDRVAGPLLWIGAAFFALLALWVGGAGTGRRSAMAGLFLSDAFARYAKTAILLSIAAIVLMSRDYLTRRGLLRYELTPLVALAALGMLVMVSAADLVLLYVGMELQALALYAIAALRRDSALSTEAAQKVFVLGALSSALFLYGAGLVYLSSGSTDYAALLPAGESETPPALTMIGLAFLIAGLALKLAAAPFHHWVPEVYVGAATPLTALFDTAPKLAALCALARLLHIGFDDIVVVWGPILAGLSLASMALGAAAALGQRDIKRMMAFASIAHIGFALIGLAAGTGLGLRAMLVYLALYAVMSVGAFAFIQSMRSEGRVVTEIAALNLYARTEPLKAAALLVIFVSLAGLPPVAGFFAKVSVIGAAADAGLIWLAVAAMLAAVPVAFAYLRVVYLIYFGTEGDALDRDDDPVHWGLILGAAALLLAGIVSLFGLDGFAENAALSLIE